MGQSTSCGCPAFVEEPCSVSDTFFSLAWTSLGMNPHGRVKVCGRSQANVKNPSLKKMSIEEVWNSDYYKKIRLDMLEGKKNSNCEICYIQEELGGLSKRIESNFMSGFSKDQAKHLTNKDGSIDMPPQHIDLRVGNICNLKCVHCWTGNSSKWYEDSLLLDKYENTKNLKIDNSWIYIRKHIRQIKLLSFLGGEPFASSSHNWFLHWLIENKHTHLSLKYVTNGTLINRDFIEKFKNVTLGISLDAIGERIEWLRYPTQWSKLRKNLFDLKSSGLDMYFSWTAYNTNIFTLPETYKYCLENFPNIPFRLSCFVAEPTHMSIQNLLPSFKEKITCKLKPLKISNLMFYLKFMNQKDLWKDYKLTLYNYLEDLDKARGTNWRDVLPEISNLWR